MQVALLNLITISSTWARVTDVMDNEVCVMLFFDVLSVTVVVHAFNSILYSVRFKTVWIYWCWCYFWSAFRFIVCHMNGLVASMYVLSLCFWKILFAINLPIVNSPTQILFARSLPICFSHDGICCPVIQKDQ